MMNSSGRSSAIPKTSRDQDNLVDHGPSRYRRVYHDLFLYGSLIMCSYTRGLTPRWSQALVAVLARYIRYARDSSIARSEMCLTSEWGCAADRCENVNIRTAPTRNASMGLTRIRSATAGESERRMR
jgi:hypothetical protein